MNLINKWLIDVLLIPKKEVEKLSKTEKLKIKNCLSYQIYCLNYNFQKLFKNIKKALQRIHF